MCGKNKGQTFGLYKNMLHHSLESNPSSKIPLKKKKKNSFSKKNQLTGIWEREEKPIRNYILEKIQRERERERDMMGWHWECFGHWWSQKMGSFGQRHFWVLWLHSLSNFTMASGKKLQKIERRSYNQFERAFCGAKFGPFGQAYSAHCM